MDVKRVEPAADAVKGFLDGFGSTAADGSDKIRENQKY